MDNDDKTESHQSYQVAFFFLSFGVAQYCFICYVLVPIFFRPINVIRTDCGTTTTMDNTVKATYYTDWHS